MGTRSITKVFQRWDDKDTYTQIASIYRHWDGYPSVHGKWLFEFLDGLVIVNGVGSNMPPRYANGPGSLAAQLVAALQADGHNPDLMEHGDVVCGQEFEYHVYASYEGDVVVRVNTGPMTAFGLGGEKCNNGEFAGTVEEFGEWIKEYGG